MKGYPVLTQEYVKELFHYTPETGALIWKVQRRGRGELFGPALSCLSQGHLRGRIDNVGYLQHRVIWLWVTGSFPANQIDHINGDGSDNRWCNLREVTDAENKMNMPMYSNNKSGVTGVYWHKAANKWVAEINDAGKKIYLGIFDDLGAAKAARTEAEANLGYHPNHGRLVN